MTNAAVVLTLDCDMYSNDPQTPLRALCYLMDPEMDPNLGFVQFPQSFHGINKNDIYTGESRHVFHIHPIGLDGLAGPTHVGTGCFFRRQVFSGAPSGTCPPISDHLPTKPIRDKEILASAHHVAAWDYENQTNWGTKVRLIIRKIINGWSKALGFNPMVTSSSPSRSLEVYPASYFRDP